MAKILYGVITDHTKKTNNDEFNERIYQSNDKSVKIGDVYSVWNRGRLAHFRVSKIESPYLTKFGEFGYDSIRSIPFSLTKLNIEEYKLNTAYNLKMKEFEAIRSVRLEEAKAAAELKKLIAENKKDSEDLANIQKDIEALEKDPTLALNPVDDSESEGDPKAKKKG